jgi:putative hemolysin
MDEPSSFLSTVQIGITLVGIFAGAFGGATVARELGAWFLQFPFLSPYSDILGITLVVLVITYLTLVFGELVPKRIALTNAEAIASAVARPMQLLSIIGAPLVFIFSHSTDVILKILRIHDAAEPPVTEDEIKILLAQGTEAGVFEKAELSMVEGVFGLDDRRVDSVMIPRPRIIALDLHDPPEENAKIVTRNHHSHFPVYEGDLDRIVGMVSVRDILAGHIVRGTFDIRAAVTHPLFISGSFSVLRLLELFKKTGLHIALVTDEYGSIQGIVSLHDILEAIVGDVRTHGEPVDTPVVQREDGSWLINGDIPVAELRTVLSVKSFPGEDERQYRTLAGLVLFLLGRIPRTGDTAESGGLRYEVVDMDGNRIDKVLVTRTGS